MAKCPSCDSNSITKCGIRWVGSTLDVPVQKYKCKNCGTRFSESRVGKKYNSRFPDEVIEFAVYKVREGLSSRAVSKLVGKNFGTYVSHVQVVRWARVYGSFKYQKAHDITVRNKVIKTILNNLTLSEIAKQSGVSYNSVKTLFRDFSGKRHKSSQLRLEWKNYLRRLAFLERKVEDFRNQILKLKEATVQ